MKNFLKLKFLLIAGLLLALLLSASGVLAQQKEEIIEIPEKPLNYVTDLAKVLNVEQENALNNQIDAIEKSTTAEIAIITIPTLEGQEWNDIDRFAYKVFNLWGIGKTDVDNGILIAAAIDDRVFRIEVGDGVEGVLTDYEARLVAENNLIPAFKEGNYYQGFTDTVEELKLFLEEDPETISKYKDNSIDNSIKKGQFSFVWAFALAIIVSLLLEGAFKKEKSRSAAKKISGIGFLIGGITLIILGIIISIGITFAITGLLLFIFSAKSGGKGGPPFIFFGGGGSSFGSGGFSSGGFGGGFGGFGGGGSSGGGFSGGW